MTLTGLWLCLPFLAFLLRLPCRTVAEHVAGTAEPFPVLSQAALLRTYPVLLYQPPQPALPSDNLRAQVFREILIFHREKDVFKQNLCGIVIQRRHHKPAVQSVHHVSSPSSP